MRASMQNDWQNLYIHVPFCARKCDYCAFYSMERSTRSHWERWLDRICCDLQKNEARLQHVKTLYFGGGTPTLPAADFLEDMFRRIWERIRLEPGAEISSEANPETVTDAKAEVLGKYVNRISMGVQSFDEYKRAVLGRHPATAENTVPALQRLRKNGIGNIGFDLMYAVPGETLDGWMNDLKRAVDCGIEHLSAYALTPEERTPYAEKHGLTPADDALSADMWDAAGDFLAENGLPRYEISNYARTGFEAKHNVNVWNGETYLGAGPSACSFDGTDRSMQVADFDVWLAGAEPIVDTVDRLTRRREILMTGLRTVKGWTSEKYRSATGSCWDDTLAILNELQQDGLLELNADHCKATLKGLAFWDEIAERLLP